MRRFIVGLFATIGFLVVLTIVGGVVAWYQWRPTEPVVESGTVITLDLTGGLDEAMAGDPIERLLVDGKPTLRDVLDGLERAADDPRVRALFVRLGSDGLGLAKVQELRDAIAAFRARGKSAIAFADTFGEMGPGLRAYYLASACEEIWLQPLGLLGLTGLRSEAMFLRGALDKLDIVPRLDHRSEYKSAMNTLTERAMTPPDREQIDAILRSVHGQIVRDLAEQRRLPAEDVKRIIENGPYLAVEAERLKLIDHIGYRDEALAAARSRAGDGARQLSLARYLERAGPPHDVGTRIALIIGSGPIQRGDNAAGPLSGSHVMASDAIGRAFRSAAADPAVRAILFRIDSPGGSAVASETIWRETVRARLAGKPVIVSMGDVAGSGGYYVAAGADKIVAQPATLTGSIGVVAGKFVVSGLWEKLGVSWDAVEIGPNASMYSSIADYTAQGERRFQASLDAIYAGFKDRVAAGRKMSPDAVEAVAKGRVWTGEDALRLGLVDALGGYPTALRLAREAAGLSPDQPIELRLYPEAEDAKSLILAKVLGREREPGARTGVDLGAVLATLRPLLERIEAGMQPGAVVTMPPIDPPR